MANKRKKTTAIVAGVTAVALLLGGTFAWTSISQQAKNESAGIVNVGGRLHDDFNGENKDVYVENFTDPLNGGQPIYARVKLTEYMEVGKEAGKLDENGDYAADRNAESVVGNATINDLDSWSTHVPSDSCAKCSTGDTCEIHDHWEWTMGGQTTYMPTFNKDKDSLDADINGTYAGTNLNDKIYYDDYVTYVTENGIAVDMNDADFEAPAGATNATPLTEATGAVTTVTGNEYYDDDTDTDKNDHANEIGVRIEENVTHTAKETADATVITMAEWLDENGEYNGAPGNYWVYDEDGWAYWANPIMPGEATGLLLSNIKMTSNPGEKCYYAINVVGQFATVNDWEYFTEGGEPSANALTLLETASKNVATVVVTNVSGETLLTPGSSYEFSANVFVNGVEKYAASDFEWSVLDANNKVSANSAVTTDESGKAMLNVGASETSKNLIVVAKAKDDAYLGALGMSSVAVDVAEIVICEDLKQLAATELYGKVTIDGMEWYVLAKEENRVLIWAAGVEGYLTFEAANWDGSEPQNWLNSNYIRGLNTLRNHAVDTEIYTKDTSSGEYVESTDKVFLLSEADLFGTAAGNETSEPKEYTLGKAGVIVTDEMLPSDEVNWLRTKGESTDTTASLTTAGKLEWKNSTEYLKLRPAMWVNLEATQEISLSVEGVELNEPGYTYVSSGTVITFHPTYTIAGVAVEDAEFVYKLTSMIMDVEYLESNVWDTSGRGLAGSGYGYTLTIYPKDNPDIYYEVKFNVK